MFGYRGGYGAGKLMGYASQGAAGGGGGGGEEGVLLAWFDAGDEETITTEPYPFDTSQNAVTHWADKSGNANDMIGSFSWYPRSGMDQQNSLNVLTFINSRLAFEESLTLGAEHTVFIVATPSTQSDDAWLYGNPNPRFLTGDGDTFRFADAAVTPTVMTDSASGMTLITVSHQDSGVTVGRVNGAASFTHNPAKGSWSGTKLVGTADALRQSAGLLAEIRIYEGVLNSTELEAVELALAVKWGLTLD